LYEFLKGCVVRIPFTNATVSLVFGKRAYKVGEEDTFLFQAARHKDALRTVYIFQFLFLLISVSSYRSTWDELAGFETNSEKPKAKRSLVNNSNLH
jgi:hypothetical protein